ncbi:3-hydroxybutyryl-CoA dehydrogenase, partial [Bifidobacterium aemilianum]
IVIEAVPERLDIKQSTWKKVSDLAPAKSIFCTNSSTLLPSAMAPFTDRPEKFLSFHFANQVWKFNTGEIMSQPQTDRDVFDQVVEFAKEMGMVPIKIHKEQPGYVLNSLLLPLLTAAADLWVRGVASFKDIDKTWKIATGSPAGPFRIDDTIGMMTMYNLNKDSSDPVLRKFAEILKSEYIDRGRMGKAVGHGFYDYQ